MCYCDVTHRYNAQKLLFRHILLKGMSNSIDDASISVFIDTIASHKIAVESVLPVAENVLKRFNRGPRFSPKCPKGKCHVTRFGPYNIY